MVGTGLATLIGVVVGLLAGYYRGWVDTILSRLTDLVLCFPTLLFGIGLASACALNGCVGGTIKPGVPVIIAVVVIFGWTYIARIVRGLVLSLREKEFVEAARALGASNSRIMFREILPNLAAPVIVYASLLIPVNILFEAALSFLGVGVQDPDRELGSDDRPGHTDLQHRMVVHGVPGGGAPDHRARFQPARRRPAGRPQPQGELIFMFHTHNPTMGA